MKIIAGCLFWLVYLTLSFITYPSYDTKSGIIAMMGIGLCVSLFSFIDNYNN